MWRSGVPKIKECGQRPSRAPLWISDWSTGPGVPWEFSSDKLLQVQSPEKVVCHSKT